MSFRIKSLMAFVLLCVGVSTASAQTSCPTSVASLNGWYGMVVSAFTLGSNAGPRYETGALLFNGAGKVSATHVYTGSGAASTATGTYAANSDCTLTLTLSIGSLTPQVYSLGVNNSNGAVGVETDANAVATIDLEGQYSTPTTGLNFTASSLNGTYGASCLGPQGPFSDTNLVTFTSGNLSGTNPYNNSGTFAVANVPYTGTYTINTDGTFTGAVTVLGTPFDFYGVLTRSNKDVRYIYSNVANGVATGGFSACQGSLSVESGAIAPTPAFGLSAASSPLTLAPGASANDVITVTATGGFSSAVSLSATGAPTGVTLTFSPASTSTTSTLGVAVAAGTVPGTYPLTIKGVSGSLTASTSVSLVVSAAPSFTILAAPAAVTVAAGGSSTDVVTVTPAGGFGSAVSLSASGAPSGVTLTFSPASTSTTSTLGIAVAAGTAAGTYPLTIRGSSGSLAASTSLSLIVSAAPTKPGFTITATPAAVTVKAPTCVLFVICLGGSSGSTFVKVVPQNGFSGLVTLSVSGVPSWIHSFLLPNLLLNGGTSTLSLNPYAAFAGHSSGTPITVTATSGSVTSTTTVLLSY